jgi:hypothetical protein
LNHHRHFATRDGLQGASSCDICGCCKQSLGYGPMFLLAAVVVVNDHGFEPKKKKKKFELW